MFFSSTGIDGLPGLINIMGVLQLIDEVLQTCWRYLNNQIALKLNKRQQWGNFANNRLYTLSYNLQGIMT